ncbi:MAG: hypothetical protein RL660_1451 [Bacteroidota bacterium]
MPILSLNDTIEKAIQLMNEYHFVHLPIVESKRLIGLVSENDLLDWQNDEAKLSEAQDSFIRVAVQGSTSAHESAKAMTQGNVSILPVLNEENYYAGSITSENMLTYLANGAEAHEQGGIVVLEVQQQNYSLSEIARICESENVSILSTLIHTQADTGLLHVTIKTNKLNLSAVLATFERMNYTVLEVHGENADSAAIKDNYDALMHYLSI